MPDSELQRSSAALREAASDLLSRLDRPESAPEAGDVFYALESVLGSFEAIVARLADHQHLQDASSWDAERVAALQRALLSAGDGIDRFAHRLKYE